MSTLTRCRFASRVIPTLVASAFGASVAPAFAQGTPALEEIIITAQKRSENLQDVPISVMSFDAKALEKKGVVTLSDINDGSVPGLSLAPYPGSSDFFFPSFRGITTNTAFISGPSPIAVHINGVYQSQLVGLNNPAADLERIEVLKGPQGVLSGRNATGGAINIYTAKPELGTFGFKQQFTVAERDQFLSKTTVNLPVGETFAAKVAYVTNSRDNEGVKNSVPGGYQFGERKSDAVRLDMRWQPSSSVTVDYGYDYSLARGHDTPPQCLYPGNNAYANWIGAFGMSLSSFLADPRVKQFVDGCSPRKLSHLYAPFDWQKNRNKSEGHTLNVDWKVSSTLTVRSITGYREIDTRNNYIYAAYGGGAVLRSDSGPFTLTNVPGVGTLQLGHPVKLYNESFSQEFQFLGDLAKNLRYTAGIYYSTEKGHQDSGPNIGQYLADLGFFGAYGIPPVSGTDAMLVDQKGLHSAKSDSWAVFGQVSWAPEMFGGKVEVVPGLRFTRDHRWVNGYNTGWTNTYIVNPTGATSGTVVSTIPGAPGFGFASASGDRRDSKTTPSLSLNYHWDKDLMTYVKYSKGYTGGGFDPVSGPASAASFSKGYSPETIKSIELGLKSELLDKRLRTNIAVFQSKFDNEQKSTAQLGGGWAVENVGGSTYKGLELDLTAAVTESLRVTASYATLSHDYDKWMDNNPMSPTFGQDVTKNRKLIVPKNDYSITVDYRFPNFGLPGRLDGTVTYSHRDDFSTPLNLAIPNVKTYSTTPAFHVVNARLALSRIKVAPEGKGSLTVALWGKNLTNEKYLTLANGAWVNDGSGTWGEPRTVGMDLIYQY